MLNRRQIVAIAPLLLASSCMPGRNQASIMTNPVFARIERRIGGRLGVALVDGDGNLVTSHRGDERFAMCSTFKAPLASALFAAHDQGLVDMDATFEVSEKDAISYMPYVQERLEDRQPVSLRSLARAAVEISDNAAANIVLRAVGGPEGFTRFLRGQGDQHSRLDRWETELNENAPGDPRDTTTPIAMARLMHELAVSNTGPDRHKRTLQEWLKSSRTGGARIRAGLPKGWPVGDKTGTAPGGTAYNDVAIIWPSSDASSVKPVILAVYTDRPTAKAKKVNAAIADVGQASARLIATPG